MILLGQSGSRGSPLASNLILPVRMGGRGLQVVRQELRIGMAVPLRASCKIDGDLALVYACIVVARAKGLSDDLGKVTCC